MKWCGKRRAGKRIKSAFCVQEINACVLLKSEFFEAADLFQKINSVGVAAHKQVLPVINAVTGCRVWEGIGAAAKMIATFQKRDGKPALAQVNASRKTCKPPTDNDNARRQTLSPNSISISRTSI